MFVEEYEEYNNEEYFKEINDKYKSFSIIVFGKQRTNIRYYEVFNDYKQAYETYENKILENTKYEFDESDDRGFGFIYKGNHDYKKNNICTILNHFDCSNKLGIATLVGFTDDIEYIELAFLSKIEDNRILICDDTNETKTYLNSIICSKNKFKTLNILINKL